MKIWRSYGSEHSMNLVMIGQFKDVDKAVAAKDAIDRLMETVSDEISDGSIEVGNQPDRYPEAMLNLLVQLNIASIGSSELEQFAYDVSVENDVNKIIITTEESDVSAFLKVLLSYGGRVEVFSAHEYSNSGYGRGK